MHNSYSAAQGVGINTLDPKSVFHIDAKGNNRTMANPENMQLQGTFQPTPNPADWGTQRFIGAYPVAAVYPDNVLEYRIILCQQITIPADSLRAYFILTFWNSAYTAPGNIYTSWGNGGEPPEAHRTGGSIVKIN